MTTDELSAKELTMSQSESDQILDSLLEGWETETELVLSTFSNPRMLGIMVKFRPNPVD